MWMGMRSGGGRSKIIIENEKVDEINGRISGHQQIFGLAPLAKVL